MRTGGMKYVILRIDTHVLRIDLCPRKRTRIRRQKQDEDVHLFLSERPLPRQGSWPGTRPLVRQGRGVSHTPTRRTRKGPNDHTPGTCIRHRWWRPVGRMLLRLLHGYPPQHLNRAAGPNKPTPNGPQGPNGWTPDMIVRPVPGRLVGRIRYAPTLPAGGRYQYPAKFAGVRRRPEAAGLKVTLACRMPRPLDQK